jgi:hypothetical protein
MISSSVDESFVRKTIVKTRIARGVIMGQMRCTPLEARGSRTPSLPQLGHGVESQRPVEPDRPTRDESFDVLAARKR